MSTVQLVACGVGIFAFGWGVGALCGYVRAEYLRKRRTKASKFWGLPPITLAEHYERKRQGLPSENRPLVPPPLPKAER